jgi:AcrR family transcriptional regulator
MRVVDSSTRRKPGLRAEAKELFRDAILRAAEEELAEHGFHAARISDIAKRASVGVGTVYNHFATKEDIVRALLLERLPDVIAELAPRVDDPSDWVGSFRARMGRMHGYVEAHRHFYMIGCQLGLFGRGSSSAASDLPASHSDERVVRLLGTVEGMVREGIAAGIIAGDPVRLTRFLMGGVRSLLLGAMADGTEDLKPEGDLAIDLFLRAAGCSAPASSLGSEPQHTGER